MDHYEISEGRRPDRLSCKALACSCGVSLSVGAPLPGCSWLAVLRVHALRNGLQRFGRRGIFKMHEKVGFKQVLERYDCVLRLSKQISTLNRKKLSKNWKKGVRNWFWGKSAA